ncbi:cytidine deaminase [[Mycoplasma] phocae]|uniref:Cytidine deaminase n=1 Tax=[Mycoplasma] phocae TaxID=142651 RepID=A0A2Z5ISF7_9BACT|nr:cytidine deaminase [[Mycoplasma] phocae]AXE60658.1 cytidine deaminase [[Mycoplasma] phocae]
MKNIDILKNKLEYAYSPYSNVKVAALAVTEDNQEYYGVNCENPAFPSGLCAERSALFGSVAYGAKVGSFKEIHIISNLNHVLFPCGSCLQVIAQFLKPDGIVYLYDNDLKDKRKYTLKDVFPNAIVESSIVNH